MAPTIPCAEPTRLVAGDTWQWTRSFPDYPISEGWALRYAVNGVDVLDWDEAWVADDGSVFTVTIPAAATDLASGRYELTAVVVGSGAYAGQRHVAARSTLVVDPNPDSQEGGDRQAWCEKMLAIVESLLLGQVPAGIQAYSLPGGRSVQLMEPAELRTWRRSLRTELYRLRNPGRGLPGERTVFTQAGS